MTRRQKTQERKRWILVIGFLGCSTKLSSNMGFSYTRPYDILDTGHVLVAPALSGACLTGRVMILRHLPKIGCLKLNLNFFLSVPAWQWASDPAPYATPGRQPGWVRQLQSTK